MRPEKYDLINCNALQVIPTYFSNNSNKVSRSTVSKAADRSSKTRKDPLPLPIVVTLSLYIVYNLLKHEADFAYSRMTM